MSSFPTKSRRSVECNLTFSGNTVESLVIDEGASFIGVLMMELMSLIGTVEGSEMTADEGLRF